MREDLPRGTVTFLFTDVEGSTRLLHELGAEAYGDALAEHRRVIRDACMAQGGVEVDTQGDAFFFAFPTAPGALEAASQLTDALAIGQIQVRVGLHTGTPLVTDEGYVGNDVHFAARVAAAGHGGQVILSSATARAVEVTLVDLGEHRLKDIAQPVAIFQLGDRSFPPLKTIANTNLPSPVSSFLGREAELYEADELLRQIRLLTVTGPGGAGKTRFALELARRAREERFSDYPAGVFACFLASLRDPALVLPTVAQALSVPEHPGQNALDALAAHLEGKRMLLLVDNLEHLLEATPELAQLLQRCEGLTALVTSREVLRLSGETAFDLPPLAAEEGVDLFCERARVESSEPVRELCARLEGLPLAIELAAARLAILTPAQLLERLSRRLDLLKAGRDADPRQQTLRATIEWSYDLLSAEEQQLFAALSVFAGGCTLEAAEQVAEADLDTLQSLVEKSLLRFTDGRYWMLETIREYAAELLDGHTARGRHAEYYARLAEELALTVESYETGGEADYSTAGTEVANLRAAIEWSSISTPLLGLRVAVALEQFWVAHNAYEGARTFEALLDIAGDLPRDLHARALRCHGGMLTIAGDLDLALPLYEKSLELYEALGDEWGIVHMRHRLATSALVRGDSGRARAILEENLVRATASGSKYLEGEALSVLGILEAREGNLDGALELLQRSRSIAHDIGFRWREAIDLTNLCDVSLEAGRVDDAATYARAGLELASGMDDRLTTVLSLATLALVANAHGAPAEAGRLWGAIEAEETRAPLGRWAQSRDDFATRLLPNADEEFEAGRVSGRAQSLEAAVDQALASLD